MNGKFKTFVQDEESKVWTLTVEDDPWEYSTLADWKTWLEEEAKKKAEAEAAAAAAGAEGMAEMAAAEGEMMAEEMAAE